MRALRDGQSRESSHISIARRICSLLERPVRALTDSSRANTAISSMMLKHFFIRSPRGTRRDPLTRQQSCCRLSIVRAGGTDRAGFGAKSRPSAHSTRPLCFCPQTTQLFQAHDRRDICVESDITSDVFVAGCRVAIRHAVGGDPQWFVRPPLHRSALRASRASAAPGFNINVSSTHIANISVAVWLISIFHFGVFAGKNDRPPEAKSWRSPCTPPAAQTALDFS